MSTLTCIYAPLHSSRGRHEVRDRERKRSRSRSKSKEREEEGTQKRKRKRASRWSDHPPSPRREEAGADETPVERAVPDEPVVGDIYNGKISSIMQFGCFVQLEGLRLVGLRLLPSLICSFLLACTELTSGVLWQKTLGGSGAHLRVTQRRTHSKRC